jgi:hypothetical protein
MRALPWPHSRPRGPGPRRAPRRHHAPPIWRVGAVQQYIAASIAEDVRRAAIIDRTGPAAYTRSIRTMVIRSPSTSYSTR